jgi:two-component system, OmpR family, sensor histidine kinase KdpD
MSMQPSPRPATGQHSTIAGVVVAVLAIAATTLIVYPLKEVAPAVSLGVVYLLAVLLVATIWGAWLGVATAVAGALAFNFFHIEPTGRFSIAQGENWVALAVFFVTALVASELAQRARHQAQQADERRREADLSAEMARLLLRAEDLREVLGTVAHRIASALGLPSAAVELGAVEGDARQLALPLREGTRQLGTLVVPADLPEWRLAQLEERVVLSLEALLGAAIEREDLLSNRVEAAALRRTDVLKTALLRSVSHDLRSPLTAIMTAAGPLQGGSITAEERTELAEVITQEAQRLSRLIDNLLDLSRLEAGAAEPQRDWCDLREVIHSAVDELALPGDTFRLQLAPELPLIRADPSQLQRAFVNLLGNSARHSGGHAVLVRAKPLQDRIMVRVIDRGPGIPPVQQERVFEPFYRAGTDRTGHRGSGLGLAIVRGFIEANGGRVWVESLPHQGTTFALELPLEKSPDSEPAATAPTPAGSET